jgi:hypothetical protein
MQMASSYAEKKGNYVLSNASAFSFQDGFKVCSKCCKTNSASKEEANKFSDVKKESSDNHASSAWTDADTLLLLEGVLKHVDDWYLIAQHVRTKNKSECIARLIQLPFASGVDHDVYELLNLSCLTFPMQLEQQIQNLSMLVENIDGQQIHRYILWF